MKSESDEMVMPKNGIASPSEDNSGGNVRPSGMLKKGPWTSAEDAILVDYVTKHGEGNWNAVQKHSGLARCGKSCRLRWANHLKPDLKKGAFSEDEENLIIELHAKMGNKWARMAAELPGRTDNEIKNFWNTRIKRRQRAGLPIYPPECLQALNDNQKPEENIPTFSTHDTHYPNFMPVNNFDVPAIEFKNLEMNQQFYPPALLNIPTSNLLEQGFQSCYPNKPLLSTVHHPSKRLRGSSSLFSANLMGNTIQYQNDCSLQIAQSFINPSSSSEPNWAMKMELPSLQTPSSPLPSLESVDTLIQTPPTESNAMSCNPSPRNSGLLEAVLYESQTLKYSKKTNVMDNLHETEWETYCEPVSPIGHSSSSIFSESTPNSFDEPESVETKTGCSVKDEPTAFAPMGYDHKLEMTNQMILTRPDFLLASDSSASASCAWNAMSTV